MYSKLELQYMQCWNSKVLKTSAVRKIFLSRVWMTWVSCKP